MQRLQLAARKVQADRAPSPPPPATENAHGRASCGDDGTREARPEIDAANTATQEGPGLLGGVLA